MKLSKFQIETISKLLKEGKPLPEDYKNIFFPIAKKEYELVYVGKEREEDVLAETMAVPLQPVKTFGENGKDWTNKLIFGDNLQVLKTLMHDPEIKGKVKLIYIDPPFSTKQDFKGSQDQKAYQDKLRGAQFIEFLRKRLILMHELLASDGAIYIHLDWRKCHYIKTILDEIFGETNFQNEIIWQRLSARSDSKTYNHIHEVIYFYTKSQNFAFNTQYTEYSKEYIKKFYRFKDKDARLYSIADLTARGLSGGESGLPWRGIDPAKLGNHWKVKISTLEELDKQGKIYWPPKGKMPRLKMYLDERKGRPLQSIWDDISLVQYASSENFNYPTQKPEVLVERIIKASSNPGDIVLDAFVGSGTTCAVAEKLGRRWIGIDCGKLAIYTIQKRMLNLKSEIGNKGKSLSTNPFTLYNAGLYDYQKIKKLPWEEYRSFALKLFQCRDEKHTVSKIELDGFLGSNDVLVFNYQKHKNIVLDRGFVDDLHFALGDKISDKFFIISPAANVKFLEDYIERNRIKYYILRIPYSIINELHQKDFQAIRQPVDEMDVNDTVEAVGFDFIQIPEIDCDYFLDKPKKKDLFSKGKECVVKIKKFESQIISKKPLEFKNRETLSMVMLDYDYDGKVFDIDDVFYAESLQNEDYEVRCDKDKTKGEMMIIYVDIFGNEKREVKKLTDFRMKK